MTVHTYTVEQLVRIAEAAAPVVALLQPHHERKLNSEVLYQVNHVQLTYGQLRELKAALLDRDAPDGGIVAHTPLALEPLTTTPHPGNGRTTFDHRKS